jgi:hypothetical protein
MNAEIHPFPAEWHEVPVAWIHHHLQGGPPERASEGTRVVVNERPVGDRTADQAVCK